MPSHHLQGCRVAGRQAVAAEREAHVLAVAAAERGVLAVAGACRDKTAAGFRDLHAKRGSQAVACMQSCHSSIGVGAAGPHEPYITHARTGARLGSTLLLGGGGCRSNERGDRVAGLGRRRMQRLLWHLHAELGRKRLLCPAPLATAAWRPPTWSECLRRHINSKSCSAPPNSWDNTLAGHAHRPALGPGAPTHGPCPSWRGR